MTDTEKVIRALGGNPKRIVSGDNVAIGRWVGKIRKKLATQGRIQKPTKE